MPGAAEDESDFLVELGSRHLVVEAQASPREDQVEIGHGFERGQQGFRDLGDQRGEPPEDPANLLGFPRAQERELGRLLAHGGGLDVDGLVARAGAQDRALNLTSLVFGDRQHVVIAHGRVIGEAENPFDLGRAEHLTERLLNSLFQAADLAAQGRESPACRVEDGAATIKAPLDRGGDAGELSDTGAQTPETGKLIAGEREPPVEIADGPKRLDRFGQCFRLEYASDLAARDVMANVMQTAERGT